MPAAPPPAMADQAHRNEAESRTAQAAGAGAVAKAEDYAATGMGRNTDHAVEQVWLDLEDRPAAAVSLRYEFRAELVRLGVLPPAVTHVDPLTRRERARGFEPGFCPPPQR